MNKKYSSLILAASLVIASLPTNVFAVDKKTEVTIGKSETQQTGIYIMSEEVPSSATDYAKMVFSDMDVEDMEIIGFSLHEAKEARLANGFTSEKYASSSSNGIYKFPIVSGGTIKGLLTVLNTPEGYGAQFEADNFVAALNNISTTADNPIKIVSSLEAFYTVDPINGVKILNKSVYFDEDKSDEQVNDLKKNSLAMAVENKNVVHVDFNNTYTDTINFRSLRSYSGETLYVSYVKNFTVDGLFQCWACVIGSIISYREGGNATTLARQIANKQFVDTGEAVANVATATAILNSRLSNTFKRVARKLSTSEIQTQISNFDSPFYTYWLQDIGKLAHAMLVKGYKKSSTGKEKLTKLVLMDPNKSGGVTILVNAYYTFQDDMYAWDESIIISN